VIDDLKKDAEQRMQKAVDSVTKAFKRIRTGRAHPSILDEVKVDYYGQMTPLQQVANVAVEDARTLTVSPWEKAWFPRLRRPS